MTTTQPLQVSAERGQYGQWIVSAFVTDALGEYLHTEQYYGYTKREAVKMFREAVTA